YIDPPFNSNKNYEVFWGEAREKRAFEDRHESTQAYIEFMRPRCVELASVFGPDDNSSSIQRSSNGQAPGGLAISSTQGQDTTGSRITGSLFLLALVTARRVTR